MYERHWHDLVEQWRTQPTQWRSKVADEVLNGKGVPPKIRPRLWMEACGAAAKKEKHREAYSKFVAQAIAKKKRKEEGFMHVEQQIRKDILRTYPLFVKKAYAGKESGANFVGQRMERATARAESSHSLMSRSSSVSQTPSVELDFQLDEKVEAESPPSTQSSELGEDDELWKPHEKSLYTVLCAISICVDKVNYHQGLNYVAAVLLICLHDSQNYGEEDNSTRKRDLQDSWREAEEDSFWVLYSLLVDYHLHGIYEPKSSFLQQYMDQFDLLVRRFLPRLHRHLEIGLQPGYPVVLFAMEWFTTLFSYSLRLDSVYLVWDLFLVARLDEALFVAGLAILFHTSDHVLQINSFEEMVIKFKDLVGNIRAKQLKESIRQVVQRIVPSVLIPPGRSTLACIEREMHDSSNLLNTADYDATAFFTAVRVGDARCALSEFHKYKFPTNLVEQGLLKASFLGLSSVVQSLLSICDASCRHSLNLVEGLTPLHVAALMGHPTVARILLQAGVDRNVRCYSDIITPFFSYNNLSQEGYTARELASAVARSCNSTHASAVLMVIDGDICLKCGRLLTRKPPPLESTSKFSSLLNALTPDWEQAVPRALQSEEEQWGGDYCRDCYEKRRGATLEDTPVLDVPLGSFTWHCRQCRAVTLKGKLVQCKRCHFSYCNTCAFTRRRLLPKYKQPVDVCQNCHHYLRSCPCHYNGERNKCMDVVCEHSPVDYLLDILPADSPHEMVHFCHCDQCLKRRYTLKDPLQVSKSPKYDPGASLYSFKEAVLYGYWDRSEIPFSSTTSSDTSIFDLVRDVEDFSASRLKLAMKRKDTNTPGSTGGWSSDLSNNLDNLENGTDEAYGSLQTQNGNFRVGASDSGLTTSASPTANKQQQFRDFRSELVDLYSMWNPSQLSKVDKLLEKYKGKEVQLLDDLHRMYGSSA